MKSLDVLFSDIGDSHFLQNQFFVEGTILGACSCPEIPLPDDWLPWTILHHNKIEDTVQADRVFSQLFEYFRCVLAEMRNNIYAPPRYLQYSLASSNLELQSFMQGLIYAHQQCESIWQNAWVLMQAKNAEKAPSLSKDLKHCILMFSTFADIKQATMQAEQRNESAFSQNLPTISRSIPAAISKYLAISGELAAYLPNQFETFEQIRD